MSKQIVKADMNDKPVSGLLDSLRQLIITGRQKALRAVDVVQVQTCWEMGRHIVEFEQGGAGRAEYGASAPSFGKSADSRVWGRV